MSQYVLLEHHSLIINTLYTQVLPHCKGSGQIPEIQIVTIVYLLLVQVRGLWCCDCSSIFFDLQSPLLGGEFIFEVSNVNSLASLVSVVPHFYYYYNVGGKANYYSRTGTSKQRH